MKENKKDYYQFAIKLFGINLFILYTYKKTGWFRLLGKGVAWKHIVNGLSFSERNGYKKSLIIGNLILTFLK